MTERWLANFALELHNASIDANTAGHLERRDALRRARDAVDAVPDVPRARPRLTILEKLRLNRHRPVPDESLGGGPRR